ncbi:MAG: hypothetical protein RML72_04055 [Bacteroidia bacterium]|nr:hypothetical protein [Bacteroidia bacterium]MDW8158036.1 hypothetical protein [Bacteroidia bacterium]
MFFFLILLFYYNNCLSQNTPKRFAYTGGVRLATISTQDYNAFGISSYIYTGDTIAKIILQLDNYRPSTITAGIEMALYYHLTPKIGIGAGFNLTGGHHLLQFNFHIPARIQIHQINRFQFFLVPQLGMSTYTTFIGKVYELPPHHYRTPLYLREGTIEENSSLSLSQFGGTVGVGIQTEWGLGSLLGLFANLSFCYGFNAIMQIQVDNRTNNLDWRTFYIPLNAREIVKPNTIHRAAIDPTMTTFPISFSLGARVNLGKAIR